MSDAIQFCLLVSRAGSTKICLLPTEGLRFGYSPPAPTDLTLYDGALADVHGTIEYDASATVEATTSQLAIRTPFRLRAHALGIAVDDEALPPREAIAVQLQTGNRIRVGQKYVLTVAEYQTAPQENGVAAARALPITLLRSLREILYCDERPPLVRSTSTLFLPHLPEIYQPNEWDEHEDTSFLSRFLALFESVFLPINWTADNFDLYLHPNSAPPESLPWLANWYGLPFEPNLFRVATQRAILNRAPNLIARKGTTAGLSELLNLYTEQSPTIDESGELYLFQIAVNSTRLNRGEIDPTVMSGFQDHGSMLAATSTVTVIQPDQKWKIVDGAKRYVLYQKETAIDIYIEGAYFTIQFPHRLSIQMENQIRALIEMYKPVHTGYALTYANEA